MNDIIKIEITHICIIIYNYIYIYILYCINLVGSFLESLLPLPRPFVYCPYPRSYVYCPYPTPSSIANIPTSSPIFSLPNPYFQISEPFNFPELLTHASQYGHLVVTLPWVVDYLTTMDRSAHFVDSIRGLYALPGSPGPISREKSDIDTT